ncbi:MAG: glycosyltransferase family 92 protein [Waddliaceae bacterium]
MKKYLIYLLLFFIPLSAERYTLSVVSLIHNEACYLKEWIEFHKLTGVEHFYLFNHLSDDNYLEILEPYIEDGTVELFDWPYPFRGLSDWNGIQCRAYKKIIEERADETKWLAIIDSDEFLFSPQKDDLKKVLKEFEQFGGVGVNWQMYGTSNVPKVLEGELMIEMLEYKAEKNDPRNFYIKSIVQPKHVKGITSPHYCQYKPGFFHVNENKQKFHKKRSSCVSVNRLRINHYWTRDEDFLYNVKIPRARIFWLMPENQILQRNKEFNKVLDRAVFRFIPNLRTAVFE